MGQTRRLSQEQYLELGTHILTQIGIPQNHAGVQISSLLDADQRKVHTHGLFRLPTYIKQIINGGINKDPNIQRLRRGPVIELMDGDHGLGAVVASTAMKAAIELSSQNGIGVVSVKNGSHFGMAAYYAELATYENQIGIAMSNTSPMIAPTGSLKPVLGNNPWAIAVPTNMNYPVTLDMANSMVAKGKIRMAALKEESIPFGWALDNLGRPTNDPKEALKGVILPIGGYKGYGITLMVDILAGVLSGADFGEKVPDHETGEKRNIGQLFISINVGNFMNIDQFKSRMDELIESIKTAPRIDPDIEVLLPGEKEWKNKLNELHQPFDFPINVVDSLVQVCQKYNIDLPKSLLH
ncbi:Ldh family oxidoreductase [Ammoniphilus resinae]|uniref:LDH2 family malate/lactate/ureidoglycolate dehydrogenase n=1 Tax=Ammoniphilus resinae TaxID=861532 RepID=A0ABS4GKT8_9BACL|nr:Ldh family oxidoreductase [Ammoniphilus resinae]MBP1930844.1 LDH2 family malate/lactate/ureidoglycolate dehydrogenase [Ammoniphilus resinae]